jgi:TPP-dependent pyruvate/acetoin dehydrogenase alpha subunit
VASEKLVEMYRLMLRVRLFEEAVARLLKEGRIISVVHLSAGQEAVAVGACSAVGPEDWITSTHRGHGHLIAKGGDVRRMFAELFGRVDGYCRGKGGSMHIADLDLGMLGANGIVGAGLPIAVGAAFASKYRGRGEVCLSFFGDGATNQGTFHEALNMAAVLKLPAIFICENNLYGEWTRQDRHQAIRDVADRAAAYGIPGGPKLAGVQDVPLFRPRGRQRWNASPTVGGARGVALPRSDSGLPPTPDPGEGHDGGPSGGHRPGGGTGH